MRANEKRLNAQKEAKCGKEKKKRRHPETDKMLLQRREWLVGVGDDPGEELHRVFFSPEIQF
jgi:hypothetical protein